MSDIDSLKDNRPGITVSESDWAELKTQHQNRVRREPEGVAPPIADGEEGVPQAVPPLPSSGGGCEEEGLISDKELCIGHV